MDINIVNAKDLDISKVKISEMKKNRNGQGKTAFISYNNQKLYIRLPKMTAPFGISRYTDERTSYSLDLSFGNDMARMENPDLNVALDFFEKLDELIVNEAKKNSMEWIGKPNASHDAVKTNYTETLKYSLDKSTGERMDYPPRIKLPIHANPDGTFRTKFFDHKKQLLDLNEENALDMVPGKSIIYPIVEIGGVWSSRIGYGVRMNLFQARVKKASLENCCLYTDVSDDEEVQEEEYHPNRKRESASDESEGGDMKRVKMEDEGSDDDDKENIPV